jgi:hypothetical protein
MFDWTKNIKRFWPAIILAFALVLIVDGTISSLETCHPPNSAGGSQNSDKDCTVLQGPLISLIVGIGDFVGDHDKGIVAAFTAILALSTIGLWNASNNLYRSGEKQIRTSRQIGTIQARQTRQQLKVAKDSAEAAKKSADAAVAAERARFYVEIDHNFLDCINAVNTWDGQIPDAQQLAASNWPMAKIVFRNFGKTPGIVIEVGTGIECWENVEDPVYDVKVVKANIIAAGDTTENFPTVINGAITLGQAKKVKRGEANIWIFGYIIYDDVFGERQTHRFFQRLVAIGSGFRYVLQSYDHKWYNRST